MNVHNTQWLTHSSGTSVEGRALHAWCCEHGFQQKVRQPTRGPYLLDLVLTDLGSKVKTSVVAGISDHHAIFGRILFPKPEVTQIERRVFVYAKAQWRLLKTALLTQDWDSVLIGGADAAAQKFTETVFHLVDKYVPKQTIQEQCNSEHPWLTDTCKAAIARKRAAFGTTAFAQSRDDCAQTLKSAYQNYVCHTRTQLLLLKKGSKTNGGNRPGNSCALLRPSQACLR